MTTVWKTGKTYTSFGNLRTGGMKTRTKFKLLNRMLVPHSSHMTSPLASSNTRLVPDLGVRFSYLLFFRSFYYFLVNLVLFLVIVPVVPKSDRCVAANGWQQPVLRTSILHIVSLIDPSPAALQSPPKYLMA
jgi:hypothetical protein